MALYVTGNLVIDPGKAFYDLQSFLKIYQSTFEPGSSMLKSKQVVTISDRDKTLYVNQREFAVISGDSSCIINALGSDMATTCHIVVLFHKDTKIAALGHFDGASTKQGVNDMLHDMVEEVTLRLESDDVRLVDLNLHIIGGFKDDRCLSEKLTVDLLKEFYHYKGEKSVRIHLHTLCASSLNSVTIENPGNKMFGETIQSPVIFGIVCDARTGELMPAVFKGIAKTPVPDVRSSRTLMGVKLMPNIYRIRDNTFVLNPFTYKEFEQIELWMNQPDHIIRKYMSTSPEVEPSNFCHHIRSTLKFIYNNPDPMRSVFSDEKALVFKPNVLQERLIWEPV